ncbi:MAG: hypothetical protein QGG48_11830 [Desulfatiglandales bacterium]|nr:hypothetical protein [Desulfatiglandales bacterium]
MAQSNRNKPRKTTKRGPKKAVEVRHLKRAVLGKLEAGFSFRGAASELGIERDTIKTWRDKYEQFDSSCFDAREAAIEQIEDVMFRSALKAEEDPRYQTSAIFFLKSRAPNRWRDVKEIKSNTDMSALVDILPLDELIRQISIINIDISGMLLSEDKAYLPPAPANPAPENNRAYLPEETWLP